MSKLSAFKELSALKGLLLSKSCHLSDFVSCILSPLRELSPLKRYFLSESCLLSKDTSCQRAVSSQKVPPVRELSPLKKVPPVRELSPLKRYLLSERCLLSKGTSCQRAVSSQKVPPVRELSPLKRYLLSESCLLSKGTSCQRAVSSQKVPPVRELSPLKRYLLSESCLLSKGTSCQRAVSSQKVPPVRELSPLKRYILSEPSPLKRYLMSESCLLSKSNHLIELSALKELFVFPHPTFAVMNHSEEQHIVPNHMSSRTCTTSFPHQPSQHISQNPLMPLYICTSLTEHLTCSHHKHVYQHQNGVPLSTSSTAAVHLSRHPPANSATSYRFYSPDIASRGSCVRSKCLLTTADFKG